MKKYVNSLVSMVIFVSLIAFTVPAKAAPSDLKTVSGGSEFAFYKEDIYYSNYTHLSDRKAGIYKMSSNLKSYKLIVAGEFSPVYVYKNTLIAHDHQKEYAVQFSLDGKVIKEFPSVDSLFFEVYENYIYHYDFENQSFYQLAITTGKEKLLLKTPDSVVQEFTLHNGWLYYMHLQFFGDYSEDSIAHLSKVKLSNPSKEIKIVKNVNNIDSLIVRDGYIYAVVHKTEADVLEGRKLYRMDYNGKKMTRISMQDMGSGPFINDQYIYFGENSYNSNQKLYRMTLNGKNVTAVATFNGRISRGGAANKNKMYFEIQNKKNNYIEQVIIK